MVDPVASAAVSVAAEAAKASGGLLGRWLGPVADEAGADLARRFRQRNVERTVARGEKKTDLTRPGFVPLRVAAEVFEKSQWSDDEFVAEYLSGVLASSRTEEGENDAGVSWAALIGRMSSDQLRLHYVLYRSVRARVIADELSEFWPWTARHFYVGMAELASALGWQHESVRDTRRIYEAAYALQREECLGEITHGAGDYLRDSTAYGRGRNFDPSLDYFLFKVTSTGTQLFLHGHGFGERWFSALGESEIDFTSRFEADSVGTLTVAFVDSLPSATEV